MGKDQDIRLNIEAAGADKAAGDVGKVDAAQKGLTDKTIDAKKPTEELDQATKKLTASEEDYTALLGRVHPALGAMADVMLKGSKVVGDLAAQEINLTAVTARATAALAAHKDTLKLLAAGGAVVAGIGAVISSLRAARAEHDRNTEAIQRHKEALDSLRETERDRQQAIERVSDTRRAGPMDAETSARVAGDVEAIVKQYGTAIDEQALIDVAGMLGDRLDRQGLVQAAILRQVGQLRIEPSQTPEMAMRGLEGAVAGPGGDVVARFLAREAEQGQVPGGRSRLVDDAIREARRQGGSTLSLEDFIRSLPGQLVTEADVGKVGEIAAGLLGVGKDTEVSDPIALARLLRNALNDAAYGDRSMQLSNLEGLGERLKDEGIKDAAPHLIRQAELVLQQLEKAARAMERAAAQPRTTNINPRFTYPDGDTRRRHTVNGQTYRTRMGEG